MKPFDPNPLLLYLTGYPDLRWLRDMTWLVWLYLLSCVFLAGLINEFTDPRFMASLIFGFSDPKFLLLALVCLPIALLGIVISLGVPLLIAITAARTVVNHLGGGFYEMLALTTLSNAALSSGYITAVIHQYRRWIGVALATSPIAIFSLGYVWFIVDVERNCSKFNGARLCVAPVIAIQSGQSGWGLWIALVTTIGAGGIYLLAAIGGILAALRFRHEISVFIGALLAFITALIMILLTTSLMIGVTWHPARDGGWSLFTSLGPIVVAVVPYLVVWGALQMAQRYVRHPVEFG